ncbi:hypothetical protein ABT076_10570 [Streptomyces sp. NPDC002131]|uniref:hypothetical protein n=1 Tax=Streptomyces sp. NPDC002131 TaxID=3154535 RepID=UPI00332025CE
MTSHGHEFAISSDHVYSIGTAPPSISIVGDDRVPLVTIHPNGTLEYGPGYDPDDAARRFWDAMRLHMPARCKSCGHVPGQQVG